MSIVTQSNPYAKDAYFGVAYSGLTQPYLGMACPESHQNSCFYNTLHNISLLFHDCNPELKTTEVTQ
jgi:hypothetical protein